MAGIERIPWHTQGLQSYINQDQEEGHMFN